MSADLTVVPPEERELRGLELAERHFPPERRAQVAAFLSVPPENPAVLPFLAFCASLNLSPIAGHAWLIPSKKKGRDGEEDSVTYRVAIGRDGLLHKARETKGKVGGYKGMSFDVVCEGDTFEVERTIDPNEPPKVLHRYASKPTVFADGVAPDRYRGRVIGAWACCFIDGEPPVFYFANLREHGRLRQVWEFDETARKRQPLWRLADGTLGTSQFKPTLDATPVQEWEGAWEYLSTMILKAAQSYVLRIGLGVTGVVPVDELRDPYGEGDEGDDTPATGMFATAPSAARLSYDFDLIENEELRERIRAAVEAANEMEPFSWAPAKCSMVIGRGTKTDEELTAIAVRIERENTLRMERRAAAEETIVDAEVVDDHAPAQNAEEAERVEALRHRLADLRARDEEVERGSEEAGMLAAEMDQVEAELRSLGVDPASL